MDTKNICSYGKGCYRRNPDHFLQYRHPYVESLVGDTVVKGLPPLLQAQMSIVKKLIDDNKITVMKVPSQPPTANAPALARATVQQSSGSFQDQNDPSSSEPLSKKFKTDWSASQDMKSVTSPMKAVSEGEKRKEATSSSRDGKSVTSQLEVVRQDEKKKEFMSDKVSIELKGLRGQGDHLLTSSGFDTVSGKWLAAAPFHLFLSKIDGVPETHHEPLTLTFSEILDPSLGAVQDSVQMNYMCDPGWLLAQYCVHQLQRTPITVFYGAENPDMEAVASKVPTLTAVRLKPRYLFGQHHTKMCLLYYDDHSVRVIVHTGNLYDSDWEDRTQGLWISPKCEVSDKPDDSATCFRKDLIEYLTTYEQPSLLTKWIERLRKVNMAEIKVAFIGSVPGNHSDKSFGHARLTTLLRLHTPEASKLQDEWTTVAQCSSIGSLGPQPASWFQGEFASALGTMGNQGPKLGLGKTPAVQLIYPSHSDVQSSLHGLMGGGCLPYSKKTHSSQPWLTGYLNHWKCDNRFRTRAMPHIKSYTRLNADGSKALWFLLSSANASKAAWGMRNKAGNLTIQAWEAGVLFLPKFFNLGNHFLCNYSGVNICDEFPIHYDFPLKKYEDSDRPFLIDNF